jgi:hypothetical protein
MQHQRLDAMLQAVRSVRPALEKFTSPAMFSMPVEGP